MKKMIQLAVLALMVVLGSFTTNSVSAQYSDDYYDRDGDVSYQTFYDELSPYGRWVEYPGQGYVWVPDAGPDFRPYSSNGHWVWTEDYEWMWVSDYDWGWAPFHYGRWDYDAYYGWYWVPGYEWSPAWVAWRDGGDYYGWAPIRPGINISINFNIGGYNPPYDFWVFAPRRYITSPRIYDYYVDRSRNVTIINQTTVIVNNFRYSNNYGFRSGPRRYDAEIYCGRINPVRFRSSYTPGRSSFRNNEITLYRPSVRQTNGRNIAPRNFERYDRNNGSFRNNDRSNGNFRNDNRNNGFRRDDNNGNRNNGFNNGRPDSRDRGRDDRNNGFRRDDNNGNRNNGFNNGRPDTRDRVRDDSNLRQPNSNGRNDDVGFRRNENRGRNIEDPIRNNDNNRQPSRDFNNGRPADRGNTDRNAIPVPDRRPSDRRFDRPDGRPDRIMEPGGRAVDNSNRFEPRNNGNTGRTRDMRSTDNQVQRQPQQFERRQESRSQPQPQVERRQEPRPQQQFERRQESRQFEQRNSGRDNSGNRGSGNGDRRGRRF